MKYLHLLAGLTLILLLDTNPANAVEYEFIGIGSEVLLKGSRDADISQSVGTFTMKILKEAQSKEILNYKGTAAGLLSINELTSDEELEDYEIISNTEMNTYGWCLTLDGNLPLESMPNQLFFASNQVVLRWYYAYAHYDQGEWEICLPVIKPRKIL